MVGFAVQTILILTKDEISLREIERILSTGNDIEVFSRELLKLNKGNKIIRFLERMEDYTREDIPEENIAPIINSLMDVGDLFPEGIHGYFATDTPMRILRLFYQLSHRYTTHEQRFKIFEDAINNTKQSLYTIVDEVGVQCQQHGKYGFKEKTEPAENMTVNSEQLDVLVRFALKKIEEWAQNGKLEKHQHLLSILYMWRRWDAPVQVTDYVHALIKDDKGLIKFIKHFLSDVRSHGMSDYVERVNWRINLKNIGTFVELDEIDKRLRTIQSDPNFNELEEKEKLAIRTFLDTRDGKIKDRF